MKSKPAILYVVCAVFTVASVTGIGIGTYKTADRMIKNAVHEEVSQQLIVDNNEGTNTSTENSPTETAEEQTSNTNATDDVIDESVDNTDTGSKQKSDESVKDKLEAAEIDVNPKFVSIDKNGDYVYIIQKNDTLSDISAMFHVSVDKIAEYNKIKNVDLIYEDSALRIPPVD